MTVPEGMGEGIPLVTLTGSMVLVAVGLTVGVKVGWDGLAVGL